MATVDLGRQIDAISHGPTSWRCPYCGRVHRKMRLRIYTAALAALAALIWLFTPATQVNANPTARQSRARSFSALPAQSVSFSTVTPTPTENPAATHQPTPSPLPIPKTGVVWARANTGAYLYAEPGIEILAAVPNGQFVRLLDEFAAYGNLPWTRIEFEGQTGWIDATKVHRVRFEGETFHRVAAEGGAFLYATPQGQPIVWLPEGTPLRFKQTDLEWTEVATLGGQTGWVLSDNLTPPEPGSN